MTPSVVVRDHKDCEETNVLTARDWATGKMNAPIEDGPAPVEASFSFKSIVGP